MMFLDSMLHRALPDCEHTATVQCNVPPNIFLLMSRMLNLSVRAQKSTNESNALYLL